MKLLIDIGNTAIKFAWITNDKIIATKTFDSQIKWKPKTFIKVLGLKINIVESIAYCSVKPSLTKLIIKLGQKLKISVNDIRIAKKLKKFQIKIDNPKVLGSDLLIGAYSSYIKYPNRDLIVISFGTATTISMIKNSRFEGAIIMPGIKIAAQNLFNRAELLKAFNFKYSNKIIGKNTQEAVNIGVVNAHLWAIKGLINQINSKLKSPLIIIAGGNNYNYQTFFENSKFEPNLIFDGMINLIE